MLKLSDNPWGIIYKPVNLKKSLKNVRKHMYNLGYNKSRSNRKYNKVLDYASMSLPKNNS